MDYKNNLILIKSLLLMILFTKKAEDLFLNHKKPLNTWNSTTCFDNVKADVPIKKSKREQIYKNIKKQIKHLMKISFHSLLKAIIIYQCSCIECYMKYLFKTPKIIKQINDITNMNITKAHDIFISKYSYGNFLSVHSDRNNGRVAFILNLSKGWKPEYGGLLHILDNKRENVIRTIVSHFNTLTLFYIPPDIEYRILFHM